MGRIALLIVFLVLSLLSVASAQSLTGFVDIDQNELRKLELDLARYAFVVELDSGKCYQADGRKFVRGTDMRGRAWMFVISEPHANMLKIEQYRIREGRQ